MRKGGQFFEAKWLSNLSEIVVPPAVRSARGHADEKTSNPVTQMALTYSPSRKEVVLEMKDLQAMEQVGISGNLVLTRLRGVTSCAVNHPDCVEPHLWGAISS